MRIYEIVTCFFIYAILGWCTEVIYAAFKERKFVNRGFLNGPICPIYGFGVLAVTLILRDYQDDLLLLFFMSLFVATLLEWATGFLLEKLFHHKWWDYSDMAFNIQGYICPLFSLIWGIACVFVVKLMHPFIQKLIHFIPEMVEKGILLFVFAGFAADLYVTIHEILKLNVRLRKMQEIADELTNLSEHLGENLSRNVITGMEKQENMKEKVEERYREYMADVSYTGRRLLEAFPKMESLHYRQQLQDIKQHLAKMRLSKRIRERRTEKDRNMLKKLKTEDFDAIYELMRESFPVDERRPYEGQRALLCDPFYEIYVMQETEEAGISGFLAVWEFDDIAYVEHFAVAPSCRNGGIGASMLRALESMLHKRICLEVELPEQEMAVRRIGFYERNGFSLNEYPYIQPALSAGQKEIPLLIMTTRGKVTEKEFHSIRQLLYRHVYHVL